MLISTLKSPARVAAGRRNRQLRGPLSDAGLNKLREAALKHKPWKSSTGPRTAAGKALVALNGCTHQKGRLSVRQKRALTAEIVAQIQRMATLRRQLLQKAGL
jgi:hypothetical protein